MKVMYVVGARPQFIKMAMVYSALHGRVDEVIVHTGQHYDYNMSGLFFEELGIRVPDYNLGVSGGSHAQMTANMMIALEGVVVEEKPDAVIIFGDTNSTLAAGLTIAKLYIPLIHIEAGARTHSRTNPEEINRICVDHISQLLFASTRSAMEELKKENLAERSFFSGNTMYDAFLKYGRKRKKEDLFLEMLNGGNCKIPDKYYYMTCHREENTRNDNSICEILSAMEQLDVPCVYPVHPRNTETVLRVVHENNFKNTILCKPVGYIDNIALIRGCEKVVTDSGGVQAEAFYSEKKCVTILDMICWPETMVGNRNELAHANKKDILEKLSHKQIIDPDYQPFGDGHASEKISDVILDQNWMTGKEIDCNG